MWGKIGTMKPTYCNLWRATLENFVLLCLLVLLINACVANVGLVPPEQMKPKELATYSMSTYNSQYDLYMQKASLPDLSDVEKQVLRAKKEGLTVAWPVIRTYVWYVDQGQAPPADLQSQLLRWLNSVRY